MEIEKVMIPIEKIINNSEECFAHVAKDNKQKETLKEHTERCQKYWKNLVEKKNLTEILEEFEKCYFNSTDEKVKEIFESMTVNIVTMHDIGKVNPEFQKEKMDHLWHRDVPLNDKVGSKHSIISSVFYLDYYIGIINLAVKNETIYKSDGEKLKDFAYIYSYIISRHHGDLTELERYLESLNGKQAEGDELGYQAGNWYELWKKSIMKQGDPEKIRKNWKRMLNRLNGDKDDTEKIIYLYCLTRLLYSLLVAADYYATTEYMNGFEMTDFGELNQWEHIIDIYEKSKVQISIRKYGKENYPIQPEKLLKEENINILRTEMFLDAERTLEKNMDKSIFYLEAPTGSGKSNTAMNLSLKMVQENEKINKIFYIYPFNTLVEQNMESMEKVFGQDKEIMSQIAIVNSLVPLKKNNKAEEDKEWNKILLDRQFLNYPIVLSTHVMLFQTLFGNAKDNVFGFHQLSHSVIVLDEIQSYKNDIWSEIISFLKGFANLMHMKIVIMSATLPNLEVLTNNKMETVRLIEHREKYFNHKKFAKRVQADYSLLGYKITKEELQEHVLAQAQDGKKILIEFIKKKSAEEFYRNIREKSPIPVLLMTGDSCILDRKRIIRQTKEMKSVILIATQVIEAGVDIDMDIGYKDISRLDSEEQFMGRINRSGKKEGVSLEFRKSQPYGIKPRNAGQYFLQEALMKSAEKAPLVIVKGMAGTAKTFYSLAVGLEKVLNNPTGEYRRILICRPNAQFDQDIGFLPGDEQEKISPLMRPIVDNLEQLIDSDEEERYQDEQELQGKIEEIFARGLIQTEAMNFIRGRSFVKTYLIIDEAQNMTPNQVKGIITRAGKGTKIILLGDPNQIDRPFLDERTNGLSYASEYMKGSPLCYQITMSAEECERSELAMDAIHRL